jgi:hypothetical protein
VGAGAWPFLVGGVICLVKSDNERDPNLLNSGINMESSWFFRVRPGFRVPFANNVESIHFLERLVVLKPREVWGKNRSVMPLDVRGCTRVTLTCSTSPEILF